MKLIKATFNIVLNSNMSLDSTSDESFNNNNNNYFSTNISSESKLLLTF